MPQIVINCEKGQYLQISAFDALAKKLGTINKIKPKLTCVVNPLDMSYELIQDPSSL